jgi:RimJ/RimL family protein N-acetyltransferase|nr:GNAT family N-acetyltransferase [uncultured Acetatifactor sp.]
MYRLRELERKDIPTINRWRNNPELVALLGAPFRYINSAVDEKWFDMYMGNRNSTIRCSIVDSEDEPIGLITLASVDYLNQSAELHIMIGEEGNCGKGIGTFALTRMLEHAFSNMNLHRVELAVLEDNRRARALYEKVGFVEEGKKREVRYKNGKFVDMVMYAILKRDFAPAILGGGTADTDIPVHCLYFGGFCKQKEQVIRLCDDAFEQPLGEREDALLLMQKINSAAEIIFAYAESVAGYVAMYANDYSSRTAYITLIGVRPEWQRKAIGSSLLKAAVDVALEKGMERILLEVRDDNRGAVSFYEKNGFRYWEKAGDKSSYMIRDIASRQD